MIARSPSATLDDLLGDALRKRRIRQAEKAYRKAVDLDPSELGHLRGRPDASFEENTRCTFRCIRSWPI